jgi:hypothetical protein
MAIAILMEPLGGLFIRGRSEMQISRRLIADLFLVWLDLRDGRLDDRAAMLAVLEALTEAARGAGYSQSLVAPLEIAVHSFRNLDVSEPSQD